ncbi:MAG: arginine--tRNA ligase [Candidatus Zixiibacteriota bacterium]
MAEDRFKREIAESTAAAFIEKYPELREKYPELPIFNSDMIYERLEKPKNPEMGSYAFPLFDSAKAININPVQFNKDIVEYQNNKVVETDKDYLSYIAVGGFYNVKINSAELAKETLIKVLSEKEKYGSSDIGKGGNVVIDFSSPNIAKPFGIGHLRSTALGHSLIRITKKLGYHPIGINHLGDWGTQFGKMIVAFNLWGNQFGSDVDPVTGLYNLYVKFHQEEETDPDLTEQARAAFKSLEQGDPEITKLWKQFKDYSMEAFAKTYQRLGVKHDFNTGESFYEDKMEATIERLDKAGLTKISEGAMIVDLEDYNLPPCLLRKADGSTLYATRDITAVLYRWETFNFAQAIYVVGSAQRDHFRQVFKVIELLEEKEGIPVDMRCSHRLHHIEFGWIKFKDQMMSTRKGNIILLDDVLDKAVDLARSKILEKNPDLKEIEKTAAQIGIGAVLFADMSSRRHKDVNFDWNEVLNFDGESGPYLQYTHARLSSLVRKYGKTVESHIDYSLLNSEEEYRVLDLLYKFPSIVEDAGKNYEPYVIVAYLFDLAAGFNKVYQRKDDNNRIVKIVDSENPEQSSARMALVEAVRIVINEGLYLLGINAPEEM